MLIKTLMSARPTSSNLATKVRARSKGRSIMGRSALRQRATPPKSPASSMGANTLTPTRKPTQGTMVEILRRMPSLKDKWSTTRVDYRMRLAPSISTIGLRWRICLTKGRSLRSSPQSPILSSTITFLCVCGRNSTRSISQTTSST